MDGHAGCAGAFACRVAAVAGGNLNIVETIMKFEIKNRFTGKVQFTAEIECSDGDSRSVKLGLAVIAAVNAGADLSGADLRDADLSGAFLRGADLSDADLSDADLSGADLSGAVLRGAYLSGAVLRGAYLSDAYLCHADLCGAYLCHAKLSGAKLSGAKLSGAKLSYAGLIHCGTRSDGYEFYAHVRNGGLFIKAGCRYFNISNAREHWTKNRGGTPLGDESMALLYNAERLAKIRGML